MHHLKAKCKRFDTKNMIIRDFGLFCLLTFICNTLQNGQLSGTETDGFRVLRQSFCGKFELSAESGHPRHPLLECMIEISRCQMIWKCKLTFNLVSGRWSFYQVHLFCVQAACESGNPIIVVHEGKCSKQLKCSPTPIQTSTIF